MVGFIGALLPTVLLSRLTNWLLGRMIFGLGPSISKLIAAHTLSWAICILIYGLINGGWEGGAALYGLAQLFWLLAEAVYTRRKLAS